ncbi:nucleotide-binding universal stress UspA family protein [Microbacterium foliorum]|uniref:Nucleotide-binding universal stress UspA family protein n=1 Tax=Microbacterium foliorum TaxID=104336 RepID=A0ABU1HQB2_9MICO|nr:universal stress protein [Microbacterium foliorum]MDR6141514.1 nucleotide-binding universal stress UspA family protein [Microbacterium foliorum]
MPARFVLGIGDPQAANGAEAWADFHASRTGVPLVRVHVGPVDSDSASRRMRESTSRESVHLAGALPEALARFVNADDTLVIGTGKTGFIRSRVFGSLSLQIAAEVDCTVAVVPQVDLRFRRGVVAGVKDDDLLVPVVRACADEARARNQPIQLIHSSFTGLVPADIETRRPVLDRAVAEASAGVARTNIRTRTTGRPPAEALLDASRNASLLVVGAGQRRGAGHALGSVTHDVLLNINAPVLIVRRLPTERAES